MPRILRTVAATVLAFGLTLAGIEAFLRESGAVLPSFVQDDARFGRRLRPGTELQFVNEGFHLGRVNEHGFLGPDRSPSREGAEIRVALLGDSFVEGFQVFDRDHFRSHLERALNDDPAPPVAVMNFGFSGFNFPRMADYARGYVAEFDPDVLLFFVGEDDFLQESTDLGPRFRADGDSLVVDLSFRDSATFRRKLALRAGRDFAFYTLLKKGWQLAREGQASRILLDKLDPHRAKAAPEIDSEGGGEGPVPPGREAVNLLFVRALGEWNASGRPRIAFVAKRPIGSAHQRALRDAGLPLWDPTPEFDRLRSAGVDPTWWPVAKVHGHWNPEGHAAMARFLEEPVRELIDAAKTLPPSTETNP